MILGIQGGDVMDNAVSNENVKLILSLFKGKEKPTIIHYLKQEPLRFNELKKRLDPISKKVLSEQLKDLEYVGFIKRSVYPEVPVRVVYSVTPLLNKAQPLFDSIHQWELFYIEKYGTRVLNEKSCDQTHPFDLIFSILGDKWKPEILFVLKEGNKRFGQIKKELSPISQKVLTQQLRDLEEYGFINRVVLDSKILNVEYSLTELCYTLSNIGIEIKKYSQLYLSNQKNPSLN